MENFEAEVLQSGGNHDIISTDILKHVFNFDTETKNNLINSVVNINQVIEARSFVNKIYMDEKIEKYILDIIFSTRFPNDYKLSELSPLISFGASPRGTINLSEFK